MSYIDKLYYESIDFKFILEEIISILHQTAIFKATNILKDRTYETSIHNFSKKYNESEFMEQVKKKYDTNHIYESVIRLYRIISKIIP